MKDSDRKMSIALFEYNQNLKKGLSNGADYTKIFDNMIYTDDKNELLDSINQLIDFKLDGDFVTYPVKYSKADLYLIFMARLLEEHNISSMIQMDMNGTAGDVVQRLTQLDDGDAFKFIVNESAVAYTDVKHGEHIFYQDFATKQTQFNSDSLVNLFVVNLNPEVGSTPIIIAVNTLIEFAKYMQNDFGYDVDYSILAVNNNHFHAFKNPQIPVRIIDELFISASQSGYSLMSYQFTGAQLDLDGVKLNIFNNGDDEQPDWGLQVVDEHENVSWFQLLLKYDFLKNWYLDNLADLEIDAK